MSHQPRSESDRPRGLPTPRPAPPIALPMPAAAALLGLRGPVLTLARALSGREGLQGKDLVLRARIGKDGSVVLAYDVLKSPENPLLTTLPTV